MIDRNIAFENLMADEPPARDVLIKNLWMIVGAYIILLQIGHCHFYQVHSDGCGCFMSRELCVTAVPRCAC